MQFELTMFPTHDAIDPMTLGRAAEQRGFESLFFPEHTHIPTSRRSPYPGGGELPRQYAAAGITRCLFMLPAAGAETALPVLDRYAELAR